MSTTYILTLSCHDVRGIVASVTGFLAGMDGFITESTQFGDPSTGRFFMLEFAALWTRFCAGGGPGGDIQSGLARP